MNGTLTGIFGYYQAKMKAKHFLLSAVDTALANSRADWRAIGALLLRFCGDLAGELCCSEASTVAVIIIAESLDGLKLDDLHKHLALLGEQHRQW